MIYTELTKKALKLSFAAHKDQIDKSGMPYVFHPFHLAEQMDTEEKVIVALLHDVVEDTDYSLKDLENMGFPEPVIQALALLTHEKGTDYLAYVRALRSDPVARTVKLADLAHNEDEGRFAGCEDLNAEELARRRKKYAAARLILLQTESS